jgi:Domain of unknown function (DUF4160)
MPTVLRVGPYRFYFYASDAPEPPHVHVKRDDAEAKFWLSPVRYERGRGFAQHELRRIEQIVINHQQRLLEIWNEFFEV